MNSLRRVHAEGGRCAAQRLGAPTQDRRSLASARALVPGLALAAVIALIQGWKMLTGTEPITDDDPGAFR